MCPEDEMDIYNILNKRYGNLTTDSSDKQAFLTLELINLINTIKIERNLSREQILGMIVGQIFMADTTKSNDESIQDLKNSKIIDEAIAYIITIENVLNKGEQNAEDNS